MKTLKKYILSIIILSFLVSFNKPYTQSYLEENADYETYFRINIIDGFIDSSKFKINQLEKFDLSDLTIDMISNLEQLSEKEKAKYIQNSIEIKDSILLMEEFKYYFYSIQKNESTQKIITILEHYEDCCADLLYLIYDQNNNLISNLKVAGSGGDGGWIYNFYGEFLSDSIYHMTSVSQEILKSNKDSVISLVDSVVIDYKITESSKFTIIKEDKYQRTSVE